MADEYVAQGTDLIAVADKIREKTETSDSLEFPNDWLSALDNMGGGLPANVTEIAFGNFMPTSTISSESNFKIAHGMKTTPNFYAIWVPGTKDSTLFAKYNVFQCVFGVNVTRTNGTKLQGLGTSFYYSDTSDGFTSQVPTSISSRMTSEHIIPFLTNSSGSGRFKALTDYLWIAGRVEPLN